MIINLVGFINMGRDKRRAEKGEWRIPEKNFFLIALIGGAVGVFSGMQNYRHKTKHWTFVIGIPLLIIWNVGLFIFVFQLLM
ncbi:DUF1294 domain-containing protein [Risungbinella massiliensis]|uniref:DUF1294 domain-containing protein n=1 Tax=Risungbinella massiliensis TaxID=1329796 RepID=UPI001E4116B3|nr:DUF1294 domain-containing protein [Risungbinella massiliensis]